LLAVNPKSRHEVEHIMKEWGLDKFIEPIGELRVNTGGTLITVE
jgi:hypothetical protein